MTRDNLASLLEHAALEFPDREAVVMGNDRYSYRQVNALANQVANVLADRGVRVGDKIALSCPNSPWFTVCYFAILKLGAVVVPLNILLKSREIEYHLTDSQAVAYLCSEGTSQLPVGREGYAAFQRVDRCGTFLLLSAIDEPTGILDSNPEIDTLEDALRAASDDFDTAGTDENDTAVLLYTSGTTGQSKGAELRHRNLRDNALVQAEVFGNDAEAPDVYLAVLPLFHAFGQTVVQNGAVAFGGKIVMLSRFDATTALETMVREKVTFFAGVPTMYWSLLGVFEDSTDAVGQLSLRCVTSGGAALPVEIHREFERRLGVSILEGYGLSETSPVAAYNKFGQPAHPGSIGVPIPGVEMKLIDPSSWREIEPSAETIGEIAIKGPNVMKGYFRRPEATEAAISPDGWFRTGDLARRDEDGRYYIIDRTKDLIIRGGYNVYPREIEEVLLTHPKISLAAVVGVPHEAHGEEVKAYVIPEPTADLSPEEVVSWAKAQMASYKYPRIVEFVDRLPMTATGKILKRRLR